MSGIKNLKLLLRAMDPALQKGKFVFCSVNEKQYAAMAKAGLAPKSAFREEEGITLILEKGIADRNGLHYHNCWALITLNVYSDLEAVGLLAKVTKVLADAKISVNVISGYYHDHIFVPLKDSRKALILLKTAWKLNT